MYSLFGNAEIDLVDLDINEAGMGLSSGITSWSEAGERLRSRITSWCEACERLRSRVTSWSGKTCTAGTDSAHRRKCPGGTFWSAQRLLCSTGQDEWDARGRLCQAHQSKAKIVAVRELVTKRSSAMATVLRMDLLSKRLPEVATTGDASGSTARGDRTSAGAADARAIDHRCEQSETNSSCPRKPEETGLISESETSQRRSWVTRMS